MESISCGRPTSATVFGTVFGRLCRTISAKLHYTNTGYGHVVHTPTDELTTIYSLLYNKFTTNGQKFATSQHLDISRCWALALRCGKSVVGLQQVVELL